MHAHIDELSYTNQECCDNEHYPHMVKGLKASTTALKRSVSVILETMGTNRPTPHSFIPTPLFLYTDTLISLPRYLYSEKV